MAVVAELLWTYRFQRKDEQRIAELAHMPYYVALVVNRLENAVPGTPHGFFLEPIGKRLPSLAFSKREFRIELPPLINRVR